MTKNGGVRFRGHETFTLREGWLDKGLAAVAANPKVFSEYYGADALGVGPNMAKAIRYWLRCAGLTMERPGEGVCLTETGRIILERDPCIGDAFTLWLVHCRIAANRGQATAWNLYFNAFEYEEFDRYQLVRGMKELAYRTVGEEGKRPPEKSVEDDCDAIVAMYLKKAGPGTPEEKTVSPFAKLGLLVAADGVCCRRQPDISRLPEDIVLYLLAACRQNSGFIETDGLLTVRDGPGRLLQLGGAALAELVDRLRAREKIICNRTAGLSGLCLPADITPSGVVEAYYGRLHRL